jgi:hypothetical protein
MYFSCNYFEAWVSVKYFRNPSLIVAISCGIGKVVITQRETRWRDRRVKGKRVEKGGGQVDISAHVGWGGGGGGNASHLMRK